LKICILFHKCTCKLTFCFLNSSNLPKFLTTTIKCISYILNIFLSKFYVVILHALILLKSLLSFFWTFYWKIVSFFSFVFIKQQHIYDYIYLFILIKNFILFYFFFQSPSIGGTTTLLTNLVIVFHKKKKKPFIHLQTRTLPKNQLSTRVFFSFLQNVL